MSQADLARLSRQLLACQRDLDVLDAYYDGTQANAFLHPEIRELCGRRLAEVVINWPEMVLDSLEHRLDVQGFRLGGIPDADEALHQRWQDNNLDEESQVTHLEAMLYGRTFVSVWSDPDDERTPRIAVETPKQVIVDYEPGTRKVRAALKQWVDGNDVYAVLHYPDHIEKYEGQSRTRSMTDGSRDAPMPSNIASVVRLVDELPNPLGEVAIVPFVNRRRTRKLDGKSELGSVIPVADAVNKLATDMMVCSEFHAMPRRYATGIQIPNAGADAAARQRLQEEAKAYWDMATAGKTWLGGPNVNFGQFAAAELGNFVQAINLLTGIVAALGALPPHYVGLSADANPASADAIRSAEASLTKRAERKQTGFGGSHEQVMRLSQAVADGKAVKDLDPAYRRLETVWSDPETRTLAQQADAAVKLTDAGVWAIPTAQERVGMSPEERRRDEEYRAKAAATAATATVQAQVDMAKRLMTEDGLSQNAALAAVGLLQAASINSADGSSAA